MLRLAYNTRIQLISYSQFSQISWEGRASDRLPIKSAPEGTSRQATWNAYRQSQHPPWPGAYRLTDHRPSCSPGGRNPNAYRRNIPRATNPGWRAAGFKPQTCRPLSTGPLIGNYIMPLVTGKGTLEAPLAN